MPSYVETVGEQLQRMRLGPVFVRRGKQPRCAPKPMLPPQQIAIADEPIIRHATSSMVVPIDVLIAREVRALKPMTLTATLLGDPEPGRLWPDGRRAP